jgi:molybdenum cofactor biosynthesis enzyme MoaA
VRLYGGEPLLIPKQKETLAFLITNGHSRKQRLVYNTNGTVFPADMIDQWQQFREVNVCISVDNLGAKFEYERNLAQWNAVEQNINEFMMIQNLHPNIRLKCVVTVSVFNILDLVDIANWITSREWKQGVFWNILHVMECFCIKNLADDVKQEINVRVRHRLLERPTIYNKEIEQILEFMWQPADSNHGIQQLRREIVRIDSQRKQWLGHSHSELADLLRILPPVIAR